MDDNHHSRSADYDKGALHDVEQLVAKGDRVFYERQIEVLFEKPYFHWVTSRAVRELEARGAIQTSSRQGVYGSDIKTIRRTGYRYYKREESRLVDVINEFSEPTITRAIGTRLEELTLQGFARNQFVLASQNSRRYGDRVWSKTNHDLDFIFERDGRAIGIECKNTLAYIDHDELRTKLSLCHHLGIAPVFVVRTMPKSWIQEVRLAGGFTLVLSWWLFPKLLAPLATKIQHSLGYQVGTPGSLETGTMQRFLNWWQSRKAE